VVSENRTRSDEFSGVYQQMNALEKA
jgi:hypothetical protein